MVTARRRTGDGARMGRVEAVEVVPVEVALAQLEAHALVQAVGRLPGRPRGEVDGPASRLGGDLEGAAVEQLADAAAPGLGVDHDVLDPRPPPRRDREHDERQRTDDRLTVAGDEERARRRRHDRLEVLAGRRWGAARQLRQQAGERLHEGGVDHRARLDVDHAARLPHSRRAAPIGAGGPVGRPRVPSGRGRLAREDDAGAPARPVPAPVVPAAGGVARRPLRPAATRDGTATS